MSAMDVVAILILHSRPNLKVNRTESEDSPGRTSDGNSQTANNPGRPVESPGCARGNMLAPSHVGRMSSIAKVEENS
jgi:hypothetical protein